MDINIATLSQVVINILGFIFIYLRLKKSTEITKKQIDTSEHLEILEMKRSYESLELKIKNSFDLLKEKEKNKTINEFKNLISDLFHVLYRIDNSFIDYHRKKTETIVTIDYSIEVRVILVKIRIVLYPYIFLKLTNKEVELLFKTIEEINYIVNSVTHKDIRTEDTYNFFREKCANKRKELLDQCINIIKKLIEGK